MNQYVNGYDGAVHALKNWTDPHITLKEWATQLLEKLESVSNKDLYQQGAIDALKKYLKDGEIDFIGTLRLNADRQDNEERQSPFSKN